jgi:hypothetical protein
MAARAADVRVGRMFASAARAGPVMNAGRNVPGATRATRDGRSVLGEK